MPQGKHATLRKTPSLTLNASPSRSAKTETRSSRDDVGAEIVPDSEEERAQHLNSKAASGKKNEVIDISSDEEDTKTEDDDSFVFMPGSWSVPGVRRDVVSSVTAVPKSDSSSPSYTAKISTRFRPSRRVIESSESEDNEVIELTDDDNVERGKPASLISSSKPQVTPGVFRSPKLPLYASDSDSDASPSPVRDEALLIFNNPPRKRKPLPLLNGSSGLTSTPQRVTGTISTAAINVTVDVKLTPSSTVKTSPSKRQPRTGKKAEAAAKLERLKMYAQIRFDELNARVFDSKLPAATILEWNNKFRTTAGKATYRRDRQGVVLIKIELAIKILDEEDRIDRTLSHEMCHLASWIISAKIDENHGQIFKAWAAKVEQNCPGIVVSTTHDYEIHHPWNWKCDFCSYTIGRFSKSIKSDVKVCEACQQGRLIPLFSQRAKRDPATPRSSRMAASKHRDSPSALIHNQSPTKPPTNANSDHDIICIHDSDSEDEADHDLLNMLALRMASTSISV